jgi:hypothetical protein
VSVSSAAVVSNHPPSMNLPQQCPQTRLIVEMIIEEMFRKYPLATAAVLHHMQTIVTPENLAAAPRLQVIITALL